MIAGMLRAPVGTSGEWLRAVTIKIRRNWRPFNKIVPGRQ
jgi:hypothetical protein